MVQSIWLNFKHLTDEGIVDVKRTIARNWHVIVLKDTKFPNTDKVVFCDTEFMFKILSRIMPINKHELCNCGCCSTSVARVIYYTRDLEFTHGKVLGKDFFWLGRNIWGSPGYDIFYKRLYLLHRILRKIQKQLKKDGIKSRMNLGDVNNECLSKKFFERRKTT